MPKLKTHKGVKGRFHITGSGKLMRTKCGKSHLRRKKAPRTKRLYDELVSVSSADKKRVGRLLPYK
ncbi:MAG: 50S ribosomal protein L35 [Chloroflexi bacterium CG07_land_8_20_14_0_80_45_17]|nr:MAG: 50S ribosomal protein L35 [Chloroflexi bacterium CG23_combo_of_CG06-09_8_20_14_all_45_10]PIU55772.1 MAG: 50S ribosomal protein L35 [Chloroflexi bacterium CG07_land_8_20_14_0_80_45_17]